MVGRAIAFLTLGSLAVGLVSAQDVAGPKSTAANSPRIAAALDLSAAREFWSFRPFTSSTPPALRQADWPRTRLDGYVLAALEANGLTPSPPADRQTFIRRATLDLIGLPPTPEEVDVFERSTDPDAYAVLIERLLASPHYGERWGRYWLDLARYCDVPESWAQTKAQAWLYRDWVVRALNEDLPYNEFVLRQLAADQRDGSAPGDLAALGFLGLSPTYWKELKLAPDVIKMVVAEEWEERIDAVSSTLLGLTVACARCHDHKFEPITQQDYYGLAGVFASIRQVPRPMVPAAEAEPILAALREVERLEAEATKWQQESMKFEEKLKAKERKDAAPETADDDSLASQEPKLEDRIKELKDKVDATKARVQEIKKTTPGIDGPLAYAVEDSSLAVVPDGANRTKLEYATGHSQDVAMQLRGNPATSSAIVPRRFLAVLSPSEPRRLQRGSGRLDLGDAIFHEAAPLAARVIVNRIWQHHFGQGLVETPSNFGSQGARPSHPELLDDLAARFIASGWSLKWLHREIMLSATYQQTSLTADAGTDPENKLLWRMNRRRLEVEAWRDVMLASSGALDLRIGGPPTELSGVTNGRRTVYGTVKRRELNDLLRLYDAPDSTAHCPNRFSTITPLQQLYVLNSEFVASQAAAFVRRVQTLRPDGVAGQVQLAYSLLFDRSPSDRELALALNFLEESGGEATSERWQQYAEVLLASNELMFVD
jgi:hypothetical protein